MNQSGCGTVSTPIIYQLYSETLHRYTKLKITSNDVIPSKNQALCKYCSLVSKLKHC